MNILITGCCGFIGANFWDYLFKHLNAVGGNHKIIGLDKLTYAGNIDNIDLSTSYLQDGFTHFVTYSHITKKFFRGDICNKDLVSFILEEYQIDTVANLAAETHVDNSIKNSTDFLQSNIMGVHNLLECFKNHIEKNKMISPVFLQISTDEVYGPAGNEAFFECDKLNPKNPYAATKAAAEHLVMSYRNTYKLPVLITRSSNNFGPYQHQEKFIPKAITNLTQKKPIGIYGNGKQIRDWLYVKDNCMFITKILGKGKFGEIYNIGADNLHKNIYVAKMIIKIYNKLTNSKLDPKKYIEYISDRPGHDVKYNINNKKVLSLFEEPVEMLHFNLQLKNTIDWYLRRLS